MRIFKLLLSVVASALMIALIAPTAQAEESGAPVIVSPTAGSQFLGDGPIDVGVDWTNAPTGTYTLQVSGPGGSSTDSHAITDQHQDGQVHHYAVYPMGPGDVTIAFFLETDPSIRAEVTINVPPLDLYNVSVSPAKFYPTVKDGYRDTATVRFGTSIDAQDVTIQVRNSARKLVRTAELGSLAAGDQTWVWAGRRDDGTKAAPGKYRVRINWWNSPIDGDSGSAVVPVTVARGWSAAKTASKSRLGYYAAGKASRNCYIHWDDWDETATPDCHGGRYAQATFRFKIPSNASHIRWAIRGQRSFLDFCCDGRIIKSGVREKKTVFRLRAKVTGWRAYEVHSARITYKYRNRI